jgi:predicted alpha/beta superfamily hydrolase
MKGKVQYAVATLIVEVLLLLAGTGPSLAQEDGSPVSIGTYRTLHSQVLNENRTLLVNLPRGYDETTIHYPVLYVLYGGQVQGYFAESVHIADRLQEASLTPQLIIVGVKNVDRYRDNLPVTRGGEKGGADRFLRFFTDELVPFIDESYRTKDFRIVLGPQAGASFGLYALMEQPDLFRVTIITNPFWSPSAREYLLASATDFFSHDGSLENFLFITSSTSDDNEATMEYLGRLTTIVEQGKKSDFKMIVSALQEGEVDDCIPSPGLREGLKTYFEEYRFPQERETAGLEDLKLYYQALSQTYGYDIDIPEFTLVRQGDRLEQNQMFEEAKLMYEYVAVKYPHDLNSYHRLAELHRRLGDYDRSIKYYEQFLDRRREPFIEGRLNSLRRYVDESAAHAVEMSIRASGIEGGVAKYQSIKSDDETRLYFDEGEFNSLGYALLTREMIDAAIEVFKMNVEVNPQSANAYDSLAEAYMVRGDKDLAIRNYEKSLERNPDNTNAKEMLNSLRESGHR